MSAIEPNNKPADDLGRHHDGAQRNHRPGAALVLVVAFAEKDVAVARLWT